MPRAWKAGPGQGGDQDGGTNGGQATWWAAPLPSTLQHVWLQGRPPGVHPCVVDGLLSALDSVLTSWPPDGFCACRQGGGQRRASPPCLLPQGCPDSHCSLLLTSGRGDLRLAAWRPEQPWNGRRDGVPVSPQGLWMSWKEPLAVVRPQRLLPCEPLTQAGGVTGSTRPPQFFPEPG